MRDVATLEHGETVTVEYPGGVVRVGTFAGMAGQYMVVDSHAAGPSRVPLDASDIYVSDRAGRVIAGHDPDPPLPWEPPDLE